MTQHTTNLGKALEPATQQIGGYIRGELSNLVSILEGNGSRTLVDFVRRIAESTSLSDEISIVEDEIRKLKLELVELSMWLVFALTGEYIVD
jgi:hypothetical protein